MELCLQGVANLMSTTGEASMACWKVSFVKRTTYDGMSSEGFSVGDSCLPLFGATFITDVIKRPRVIRTRARRTSNPLEKRMKTLYENCALKKAAN